MSLVTRFDTPGSLRDLPPGHPFYVAWHARVSRLIESVTRGNPRGEFFNASDWDLELVGERRLTWMGFPRAWLVVKARDERDRAFRACEQRERQEEYLEWHVTRRNGKIVKAVFVTETPEYWRTLARADRTRVLALYRSPVDRRVKEAEIFSGPRGAYNARNVWNTERGIVHYMQRINTLRDALKLSQRAVDTGDARDNFEMPSPERTSADPRVALDIGVLARRNLSVTLRDPVGLYMAHWDDTGWTKPNGRPVGNYWRVRRGAPGAALRLEYQVPASEHFAVGDIRIGGRPIDFGGQIAEHVTVVAVGLAGQRRA